MENNINAFSKVVLGSLFKKPATAMYPVVINEFYENTRGHITYDPNTCIHCTLCDRRCPTGAIKVDRAEKTWMLDNSRCVMCLNCISVCNKDSLGVDRAYSAPSASKESMVIKVHSSSN